MVIYQLNCLVLKIQMNLVRLEGLIPLGFLKAKKLNIVLFILVPIEFFQRERLGLLMKHWNSFTIPTKWILLFAKA